VDILSGLNGRIILKSRMSESRNAWYSTLSAKFRNETGDVSDGTTPDWPRPVSAVVGRKATDLAPLLQIDDGILLNQLSVWAPDATTRKKILVDNRVRLYGF
jgi:hypothetical protein